MAEAWNHSSKWCVIPHVLLLQTPSLFCSLSFVTSSVLPVKIQPFSGHCSHWSAYSLVLTHSLYNITDVFAQLISALKMEVTGSSKTWVIVHQTTRHHSLHFLQTICNDSVSPCDYGGVHALLPGHLSNLRVRNGMTCLYSALTGCPDIQITTLLQYE
jgi:hypothetical protein